MSEVTQEDRDAAARAGLDIARLNERDADALRQGGEWDEWSFVQAFARHRTTALAALEAENAELRAEVERLRQALQWIERTADGYASNHISCHQCVDVQNHARAILERNDHEQ
jgi:hypothetical protein